MMLSEQRLKCIIQRCPSLSVILERLEEEVLCDFHNSGEEEEERGTNVEEFKQAQRKRWLDFARLRSPPGQQGGTGGSWLAVSVLCVCVYVWYSLFFSFTTASHCFTFSSHSSDGDDDDDDDEFVQ